MRILALPLLLTPLALSACSGHGADNAHASTNHDEARPVIVQVAAPPTKQEVAALFDLWNETLQTGGPNDMALLYAEDGVLLPTVSNEVRSNRPEIADYFVHFLELHPRGVINEQHIDILDANTAVNSGVYTFDVIKNREPTYVVARYSFLYEKIGGKWLIKSHHSSAMPEPVATRPLALARTTEVAAATQPAVAHAEIPPKAGHEGASDHGAPSKGHDLHGTGH